MPNYRRAFVPGGCWFFTVNLLNRRASILTDQIEALRDAMRRTRQSYPFKIDAFVVLPDHAAGTGPVLHLERDGIEAFGLIAETSLQRESFLTPGNHVLRFCAAGADAGGEHRHRFNEVGFSRAVRTQKQVHARVNGELEFPVISELSKKDRLQEHPVPLRPSSAS